MSYQVVQEALNVLTRTLGATPSEARRFLDDVLAPLWRVGPSPELYVRALEVRERYGFSLYDALVLAWTLAAPACRAKTSRTGNASVT